MESVLARILSQHYEKFVVNVTEQEGGWSARAYKVKTTDGLFFFKVYDKHRISTGIWTAKIDTYMPIVMWLYDNTNLHRKIICPVLTVHGQYRFEDKQFIYLLFPYIEGYTLCEKPLSETQVKELADIVSELHKYNGEIPVATNTIQEDFEIPFCQDLKELLLMIDQSNDNETKIILKKHEPLLLKSINTLQELAAKISKENLHFVLCHTDIHGWNLMQSDRIILIDWEGMRLAPPEADLFAFIGDKFWHKCSIEFMKAYRKAHPDYVINTDILKFYQIRRRIEDICAFAQGLLLENIDDEERKQSLYHLSRECIALSC